MQSTITKILLAFCFMQAFKIESLVWAQDAVPLSSIEQTTQYNSREEGITSKTNSLENVATSETLEELTTTIPTTIDSCEDAKSKEVVETCACRCAYKNGVASAEVTTETTSGEQTTTIATNERDNQSAETTEAPQTNNKPEEESTTNSNQSAETTEAPQANNKPKEESTTSSNEINTQPSPSFTCTAAGNFAHPADCRRYYNCYPIVNSTDFEITENVCPTGQAFNSEFSSCLRDLSSCSREHGGFECLQAGSFADPESDTASYYRCVPRLGEETTPTFHVFHISCGAGKIYMPQLGKCFYDLNAPQTGFNSKEFNGIPDDEQLVKAELKQWKIKEKTKLKEEKLKLKYEKKLQKELAKKASKEAKEKTKKEEKTKKGKTKKYDDDD